MRTFKENEALHKELWGWCAETGNDKADWPRWKFNGGDVEYETGSLCFACSYAESITEEELDDTCSNCPICDGVGSVECLNGLYDDWWNTYHHDGNEEDVKELAAQIRDLDWIEPWVRER